MSTRTVSAEKGFKRSSHAYSSGHRPSNALGSSLRRMCSLTRKAGLFAPTHRRTEPLTRQRRTVPSFVPPSCSSSPCFRSPLKNEIPNPTKLEFVFLGTKKGFSCTCGSSHLGTKAVRGVSSFFQTCAEYSDILTVCMAFFFPPGPFLWYHNCTYFSTRDRKRTISLRIRNLL